MILHLLLVTQTSTGLSQWGAYANGYLDYFNLVKTKLPSAEQLTMWQSDSMPSVSVIKLARKDSTAYLNVIKTSLDNRSEVARLQFAQRLVKYLTNFDSDRQVGKSRKWSNFWDGNGELISLTELYILDCLGKFPNTQKDFIRFTTKDPLVAPFLSMNRVSTSRAYEWSACPQPISLAFRLRRGRASENKDFGAKLMAKTLVSEPEFAFAYYSHLSTDSTVKSISINSAFKVAHEFSKRNPNSAYGYYTLMFAARAINDELLAKESAKKAVQFRIEPEHRMKIAKAILKELEK
jgi:hypothetical protein